MTKPKQSQKPKTKINQMLFHEKGKFIFTFGKYRLSFDTLAGLEEYLSEVFALVQEKIEGFEERLQVDFKLQDELLKQFWAKSAGCQSCHNHPKNWGDCFEEDDPFH